tara:strand:- start:608 stop:1123 length:516 start_codon:yes stop_codon:yes gene_type:complete
MRKYILIGILFFAMISTQAQKAIKPMNIDGKDVYALSLINTEFDIIKWVDLTDEQINNSKTVEGRLTQFIKDLPTTDFDALMTRDGKSALLMKYKVNNEETSCRLVSGFAKDVYFLSVPSKQYKIIEARKLTVEEIHLPFNKIVKNNINYEGLKFDGIIISSDKVEYIVYK